MLCAALAAPLAAQEQDDKPKTGKIDGVEREADESRRERHGGGFFLLHVAGDVFGFFARTPTEPGQGYQRFPWAGDDDEPFVRRHVDHGRRFHTLSFTGFDDAASTLNAGTFAFQTTNAIGQLEIEFSRYAEPKATETDHLHLFRAGMAALPPLGRNGFLRIGGGFRGLVLDDGRAAGGPELEIGGQFFPARPFGVSVSLRGALLGWEGGSSFVMAENVTTGSVFMDQVEFLGGWRWTKIENVPAFGGPTVGLRVWF